MLADHRQGVVAGERRPARHHLVEQCPERVEVTPRVGRAAERLLRSHVEGGAKHHPGHREPRAIERGGEPEVAELRNTPRCEPHVPRLDVAVHDAVAMCVLERLAHLLGDRVRAVERQTMGGGTAQEGFHVAVRHELGHDVRMAVLLTDVVHGNDVGMVTEARHCLRIVANPGTTGVIETFGLDERDRDLAVEASVVREVHALLAALAEEVAQDVAAVRQRCKRVGHRLVRILPQVLCSNRRQRIFEILSNRRAATPGSLSISLRIVPSERLRTRTPSVAAYTSAERGWPSRKAISPKTSPALMTRSNSSPSRTSRVPSSTTNMLRATPPFLSRRSPALHSMMLLWPRQCSDSSSLRPSSTDVRPSASAPIPRCTSPQYASAELKRWLMTLACVTRRSMQRGMRASGP